MAPEALFNPSLVDMEAPGVAEQVFQCIQVRTATNPKYLSLNALLALQMIPAYTLEC